MPKGARQLSTLVWGHLTPSCENDSSGDVSSVKLAQANIIKAAVFARAITHSENKASATSFRRTRWMQKNQKKAVKPRLPTLLLTSSHGLQKPKHRPGITPPPWMLIDCYGGKKVSDLKTSLPPTQVYVRLVEHVTVVALLPRPSNERYLPGLVDKTNDLLKFYMSCNGSDWDLFLPKGFVKTDFHDGTHLSRRTVCLVYLGAAVTSRDLFKSQQLFQRDNSSAVASIKSYTYIHTHARISHKHIQRLLFQ